jgi:hypothetical protein
MAQRTVTHLVDDIDGGEAEETVTFALDGVSYEVDLSSKNASALRDALTAYTKAGRRIGGRRASAPRGSSRPAGRSGDAPSPTAVREWAKSQGIEVNERGRISKSILEQYQAAQG